MTYEIDQSGKVEDTSKDTILAAASMSQPPKTLSIILNRKVKRQLQDYYRRIGKPRKYTLEVFTILLFNLIILLDCQLLSIDNEYTGKEDIIGYCLQRLSLNNNFNLPEIRFVFVGKSSNSHKYAYSIAKGSR